MRNLPWKFGGKQCIEYNSVRIPLKHLSCKSKIFLELILDAAKVASKEIVVDDGDLSETLEELLCLNQIVMNDVQELLSSPFDARVKRID